MDSLLLSQILSSVRNYNKGNIFGQLRANNQFYDFYFNIRRKLSVIQRNYSFSVWLRTGSYSADINRFRSHTGKFLRNLVKCFPLV